jgi:hypothetical protein
LIDAAVHSEHGKVIQSDFKPGSVERSIALDKERYYTTINFSDCYWSGGSKSPEKLIRNGMFSLAFGIEKNGPKDPSTKILHIIKLSIFRQEIKIHF